MAIGESIVPIAVTLHVTGLDVVRPMGNAMLALEVTGVIIVTIIVTYRNVISATRKMVVACRVVEDIGDCLVTRNVTQIVSSATRLMVVACCVMMDIGDCLVTRNVTQIVSSATRQMVFARVVMADIGERLVTRNVAQLVSGTSATR